MSEERPNILKLTEPHINAFDTFVELFPKILKNINSFEFTHCNSEIKYKITSLELSKPYVNEKDTAIEKRIFPKNCRLRGMSYKGRLTATFDYTINNQTYTITRSVGAMPIMIKSKYCNLYNKFGKENVKHGEDANDIGGYFIVNGNEKVVRLLISQKRNHIFAIIRESNMKKGKDFSEYCVSARCVGTDEVGQINFLHYLNDGNVMLRIYIRKREFYIPIVLMLKSLIEATDEEIFNDILREDDINCSLNKRRIVNMLSSFKELDLNNQCECLKYLGSKFKILFPEKEYTDEEAGHEIIKRCIAIHIKDNYDKYNFLIVAIKKLYRLVDNKRADNPDSQMNHEIMTVTQLFSSILKEKITDSYKILKKSIQKLKKVDKESISDVIKKTEFAITNRFDYLISTGNVNLNLASDITETAGFTLLAEKINFLRFISHFRSVNRGNFFAQLKTTAVRKLKPESWGFFCPVHTPDGSPCGIITHLAHRTIIIGKEKSFNQEILFNLGLSPILRGVKRNINEIEVFLDGRILGFTNEDFSLTFVKKLRNYRSDKNLEFEVVYIPKEEHEKSIYPGIYIFTSIGRLMRPVINSRNKIEHIGILEQIFLYIKRPNDDSEDETIVFKNQSKQSNVLFEPYREIDNNSFLSVVANLTPFSDFNQSPRNMYQCQMAKQTMGTAYHNHPYRSDNKAYKIIYPQSPIVKTKMYDHYNIDEYPMGINAIVAVLSYTGYDMEDAMVINKMSMERGFFYGSIYKTESVELENKDDKIIETPEVGSWLGTGDLFYRIKKGSGETKSILYKGFDKGIVESVKIFDKNDRNTFSFSLTLRIPRNPSIGDKFCSRHGQKGVCSMHWPTIDMPFTDDGLVPDIIINPHAFPSRMTIGMLIESMAGKSGCLQGKKQDGSPFQFDQKRNGAVQYFGEELKKCGYNYFGNQTMYSGVTGAEFQAEVFIGVVYYQRLRHMVSDKFQVRTTGSVHALTRQPIGGRKRKGGVRLGEMERDALIGHGCSYVLQDRLMYSSDYTKFIYCVNCKSILFVSNGKCSCGGKEYKEIGLPYVFKYLCAELMCMNIKVTLEVE